LSRKGIKEARSFGIDLKERGYDLFTNNIPMPLKVFLGKNANIIKDFLKNKEFAMKESYKNGISRFVK
jgi:hypothetical protein